MAIVYDVPYPFVLGGGQWRMFRIAQELVKQGWRVDWYCFRSWEGDARARWHEGIRYIGITKLPQLYEQKTHKRRVGAVVRYSAALALHRNRLAAYDVVWFGQWPIVPLLTAALTRLHRRTRVVVDWWEYWGSQWLRYGGKAVGSVGWLLERAAVGYAIRHGTLVAISASGQSDVRRRYGDRQSLMMIPNGVDVSGAALLEPARPHSFRVGYLGRLVPHKNVDHLIYAASKLRCLGVPLDVDIVGDGPELPRLRELAEVEGVSDRIRFHGALSTQAAQAVLRQCVVFVHPSLKEGGGSLTVLEAFDAGLPVICYDSSDGIDASYVPQEVVGLRVNPWTAQALADAIREVLSDRDRIDRWRRQIPSHLETFSWKAITQRYLASFGSTDLQASIPSSCNRTGP